MQRESLDGLAYIERHLQSGQFEETVHLFASVVQAFGYIQQALQQLTKHDIPFDSESEARNVLAIIDDVASAYESEKPYRALSRMKWSLLPSYKQWVSNVHDRLQPYILS